MEALTGLVQHKVAARAIGANAQARLFVQADQLLERELLNGIEGKGR
jgi:hypothetical protein